jgi:hypothetical protein
MNLIDTVTDAIWEGFEAEDNACVDRSMDLIDTGETFSMSRVAQHLLDNLRNAGYRVTLVEDFENDYPELTPPAEIPTANLVDD